MLRVRPEGDASVLELLRRSGVLLESPCNGKGTCGKCKIRVLSGRTSPMSAREEGFLTPEERAGGIRLACLTIPLEEVELDPLGLLEEGSSAVLGGGEMPEIRFDPMVTGEPVTLTAPTLEDGRAL